MKNLDKFIKDQLSLWPEACANFRSLRKVETRKMMVGGLEVVLQHNPARIISSAAKVDPESLKRRKCFLCSGNRPAEQTSLDFDGRKGRKYDILVNPYPIFRNHLVIAMKEHLPQSIWRRYVDMLDIARAFQDHIVFYNGPQCGASAPDHHHFQAAARGQMPLETDVDRLLDMEPSPERPVRNLTFLASCLDADLFHYGKYLPGIFIIRGRTSKSAAKLFYRLLDCTDRDGTRPEPLCNVFAWYRDKEFRSIVVFRSSHRSHHYFSDGPDHLTMSPGCADMAGCLVVPVAGEFRKIDSGLLSSLLSEVALGKEAEARIIDRLTRVQNTVSVGILSSREISFEILSDGAGPRKAVWRDGKIEYDGSRYDELFFEARTLSTMFAEPSFMLFDVVIGRGFHWERKETQKFAGALKIIVDGDMLTAVNMVGVEDYLVSVISSEMNRNAPAAFLKAHAVISRSWLAGQMQRQQDCSCRQGTEDNGEIIRWYGGNDHKRFDVCADDHCQRYQGLTRASGNAARDAVDATWGELLKYNGEVCDARFSKCCGGVMEKFSTCWDDSDHEYLRGLSDTVPETETDLSDGKTFRAWLEEDGSGAFCGKAAGRILSEILNNYDLETPDFFRWQADFRRDEISRLFARRSGRDVGEIQALVPVSRGVSGRISRLKVIGAAGTVTIGKELEIRRVLSESHLKSSAFTVDYIDRKGNLLPADAVEEAAGRGEHVEFSGIRLRGAGWGHGGGLCQTGAAVMASEGYGYRDILRHYYPGAEITGDKGISDIYCNHEEL